MFLRVPPTLLVRLHWVVFCFTYSKIRKCTISLLYEILSRILTLDVIPLSLLSSIFSDGVFSLTFSRLSQPLILYPSMNLPTTYYILFFAIGGDNLDAIFTFLKSSFYIYRRDYNLCITLKYIIRLQQPQCLW